MDQQHQPLFTFPETNNNNNNNPLLPITTVHRRMLFSGDTEVDGDHANCVYWRPLVVLDMVWNLAFTIVAAGVLLTTLDERPNTPLRVWLCGYAIDCVIHIVFVYFQYSSSSPTPYRVMKKLEPVNTVASSVWWAIGFYWIVVGDQYLLEDSPRLYWLTVIFLAIDVFAIVFCIGLASIVFFALICSIPVIAVAFAMRVKEGASEEDIMSLPKYRFSQSNSLVMVDDQKQSSIGSCKGNHTSELSVHPDDSECCICLSSYVEGAELHRLPCTHHFHCGCISQWLRTKATCPLCKFNILRRDMLV
ncbi:putative transcription factor C2H2 family [Lupinus albus]|uniref:RING-type E3 ubiquitin transferase n=1 Tax=Lupinus albus TaxID=3870 RepID=A0A6A4PBC5_LUPAL|nr:putative transcription factor C2H2 family [Lupinus albus]